VAGIAIYGMFTFLLSGWGVKKELANETKFSE
jgi:hypothetical protein